jgi:hypothetical protein
MKRYLLSLVVLIVAGGLFGCVGPLYDYGPYGPGYGYSPDGVPVYAYGYPYPAYDSSFYFSDIHRGHDLRHRPTFHDHHSANFNRSLRGDLRYHQNLGRRNFRQSASERSWQGHRIQQNRGLESYQHQAPPQIWSGRSPEQRAFWGSRPANGRALRCSGSRC